ncbi:hypothetical protein ERICI_01354 [Paenibacillus larvae subsp. larvae]|uniref:Acetyltransferase n=5 Tax=root TaxID=1 RepID=A0A0K2CZB3_9CAUD|nr:Mom-like DNA modification protein [Paenibacillus phage Vegas]ALA12757.1 acetyltransferase [Paenibacillus phage Hayley]ALA12842.1 acetyltransferase [Paenibacillus phage Vadim]ALA12928.1 acetyltransferase [Paenibacillus phage Diane]AVF21248.1 hypothetical protein ERICI_01354 [Paenibacillus larvae subsp. larvae]UYE92046.1 hypothetical protein LUNBUN_22 [Paenibacillus phage LunBun]UYE92128.1 hypothetical protein BARRYFOSTERBENICIO_22 [Paenibacillus phage BarryFoster_Benicio]UYL91492.1 hypothe
MKNQIHVEVSRSTELDRWIAERHYLKSTPAGAKLRLWILDERRNRIGAMMWGRPISRNLDQSHILELTRLFCIEDTDPFVESKALSLARKIIRKTMPDIKGLIAYSSTGEAHRGTIYQADNWFVLGVSKSGRWSNRPGREDRDTSVKKRWCRTP